MKDCACYIVIKDAARAELYRGIFAEDHVPIEFDIMGIRGEYSGVPLKDEAAPGQKMEFYKLDLDRATEAQLTELAQRISPRFKVPVSEILSDMKSGHGAPIRSDGVEAHWCQMHMNVLARSAL